MLTVTVNLLTEFNLIETFCIVNSGADVGELEAVEFNRNILYCKSQ